MNYLAKRNFTYDKLVIRISDMNVHSVPAENILQGDDSADKDSNFLGYIFFVYIVSIVGLITAVVVVLYKIRCVLNTKG